LEKLSTAREVLEALGHDYAESVLGTKGTNEIASSSAGSKAVSSEKIPSLVSTSFPSGSEFIQEQRQAPSRMPRAVSLKEILKMLMKETSPIHASTLRSVPVI
jgi:hypothetical protein